MSREDYTEKKIARISLVSNTSWSVYNFRLGLLRELKARGVEVHVIAPKDRFSAKLVSEGFRFHPLKLDNYSVNPIWDLQTFIQLVKYYRRYRFDHVMHYTIKPNIYGSMAAHLTGTPSYIITTGLGRLFSYKNWLVQRFVLTLYRIACRLSDRVGFVNRVDLGIFLNRKMVKHRKAFVLQSEGIDLNYFRPRPIRANEHRKLFLYAGRIIWSKGLDAIIYAAREFKSIDPTVQFCILGFVNPNNPGSVSYEKLEQWQEEGLIEYLGETEDVRPHVAQADCIVFPSYYGEGISRILLEGAAMAKPIITCDHVGCREVVRDLHNGILCRPGDKEDFVRAVTDFLALDREEQRIMGMRGRTLVVENYDEKIVVQKYLELLGLTPEEMKEADVVGGQSNVASI